MFNKFGESKKSDLQQRLFLSTQLTAPPVHLLHLTDTPQGKHTLELCPACNAVLCTVEDVSITVMQTAFNSFDVLLSQS